MNTDRITRVNELLRREIAEALFHVLNEANLDLSALTITRVIASRNLRNARVLVSIRDNVERRKSIIAMLTRHRAEMQAMINKDCQLKFTPRLVFELDPSLEKGDHVLAVLSELNIPEEEPEENSGSAPDASPDEESDD